MNLVSLVPGVVKGLWDLGSQYFQNKKEKQQAIHNKEMEVIATQEKWDLEVIRKSDSTWKDEFLLLVFSMPILNLFIGPYVDLLLSEQPYQQGDWTRAALQGLVAVDGVGDWYVTILMVMVASSFGYKKIVEPFINKLDLRKK